MSRARHQKKATGGMVYAGRESNVIDEAAEKKKGGRTKRADGGKVDGDIAPMRPDRAPRRRGGRTGVGADKTPLSSAARTTAAPGHTTENDGNASGGDRP